MIYEFIYLTAIILIGSFGLALLLDWYGEKIIQDVIRDWRE